MFYVVAYDIVSNRRRRKVFETLKNYGLPVQKSVVECDLDRPRFERMRAEVAALVNAREDQVRFYRLSRDCFFDTQVIGVEKPPLPE